MMSVEEASIEKLMDELESSGMNIAELRRLYQKGKHAEALRQSLLKLYQAHKFAKWFYR